MKWEWCAGSVKPPARVKRTRLGGVYGECSLCGYGWFAVGRTTGNVVVHDDRRDGVRRQGHATNYREVIAYADSSMARFPTGGNQ